MKLKKKNYRYIQFKYVVDKLFLKSLFALLRITSLSKGVFIQ